MSKLTQDALNMMDRFPGGWSMRASDLNHYHPNSNYATKVFRRMMELANAPLPTAAHKEGA